MSLLMPSRRACLRALTAAFLCLGGTALMAQSTGAIAGMISDTTGGAIPGASIMATNQATGLKWSTISGGSGDYQIVALPTGPYQLEVQAPGFQTQVIKNLPVAVAQTTAQNIQLTVGQISETLTVDAAAPVVQTATMAVSQVVDQRTVQEIPLNGRHFVDLGLLLPGSVVQPQNGFLTAPLRGQGAFAFNTAGNREDTVNFMINGVNLNDMVQNQITFQPSINTVSEFKADNSTFSAEYGRNSGAIVNIATRSGSNQFHGEAFEFFRNEKLDAKNFFDNPSLPIPPFKRNQFGFSLGAPIWLGPGLNGKDRSFFFFSYEGLRQRQKVPFNTIVPTAAERAAVTDPVALQLLKFIPQANLPDSRFAGSGTAPVDINQWTLDISHRLNSNDTVHGYYANQHDLRQEPSLQGNNIPGFGDTRKSQRQIFTFGETHTFGPAVVNDFRFGLNRIFITFDPNARLNPAAFGINNGVNTDLGLPQINIQGSVNFGGPSGFPQGRADTVFVYSDTLSKLAGRHSLKFGGEVRRFHNNNFSRDTGVMVFTGFDKFEIGSANSYTMTQGGVFSGVRTAGIGFFAQDNYKAASNLTLELGVRWELNTTPAEVANRFVVFDPSSAKLLQLGNGLDEVYPNNYKQFGPRVGFAWDPFKDGKTSIRGGYGLFYDQPVTNTVSPLASNPPFGIPSAAIATSNTVVSLSDPLAGAGSAATSSPANISRDFRNDYVQSWNLNLQREIVKDLGVQIGYFGSKGTHLRMSWNMNQFVNSVRPYAGFSNINTIDSVGNSSYNGLWVSATKRLSRGVQFSTNYTWSHSIDYNSLNSQGVTAQDSFNRRNERGSSDFDARHHFNLSFLYDLPFKGSRLTEGWSLSGIITSQSGNPVNIIVSGAAQTGLATRRANVAGDWRLSNPHPAAWFNQSAFCAPGRPGCAGSPVFGNIGRNVVTGPGFNNVDFSVIKTTKISEAAHLQFRTEFFDLFNHPNFGQPGRIVGAKNFGIIESTRFPPGDSGSARQIQFALKVLF